mmetsp:Transcript_4514/g.13282  ORF Transcript_4514/g.13282 Transcript_4514/m.13282 type:complete len:123 (+) Transcript_4514:577-945(+)
MCIGSQVTASSRHSSETPPLSVLAMLAVVVKAAALDVETAELVCGNVPVPVDIDNHDDDDDSVEVFTAVVGVGVVADEGGKVVVAFSTAEVFSMLVDGASGRISSRAGSVTVAVFPSAVVFA